MGGKERRKISRVSRMDALRKKREHRQQHQQQGITAKQRREPAQQWREQQRGQVHDDKGALAAPARAQRAKGQHSDPCTGGLDESKRDL